MFATAAVSARFAGAVADRLPTRLILTTLYTGSVVAVAGASLAPTVPLITAALVIAGFATSLGNPVTNRLITARDDQSHRGLLVGVKQSGVQVTQLLTGLLLPAVGFIIGWKAALDVALVLPLAAVFFAWRFVLRDAPSSGSSSAPSDRRPAPGTPLPAGVWWLCGYAFLSIVGLLATITYLPLFAFDSIDLDSVDAGLLVAVIGGAGILARVGWGQLSDRLRSPHLLMVSLASAAAISEVLLLTAGLARSQTPLWVGTLLFAVTGGAIGSVTMVATIQLAPWFEIGRATGVVALGQFAGDLVGPPIRHVVAEHWVSSRMGTRGHGIRRRGSTRRQRATIGTDRSTNHNADDYPATRA